MPPVSRLIVAPILLALCVSGAGGAGPTRAATACPDADLIPAADNLDRVRTSVLCLIDSARADRGEPPLTAVPELERAASGMARAMVEQRFFDHVTPDGRTLADRVEPTGFMRGPDWLLGENLAWARGEPASAAGIVRGWMDSRDHRLNLLHADFEDVGLAITSGSPWSGAGDGFTFVLDLGMRGTRVSVPASMSVDAGRAARGFAYRATCSRRCRLVARLTARRRGDDHPVLLATGRVTLSGAGAVRVELEPRENTTAEPRLLEGRPALLSTYAAGQTRPRTTRVLLR